MKILKAKKGISTIIAVLLMIVISVAAAVITYIWVMGYIGGTMSGVQQQTEKMQISIDAVSNATATANLTVAVRNVGEITATVNTIYVGTSTSNLASVTISPTSANIDVGGTQSFTATFSWVSGTQYTIKVVCTDGQSATTSWTAP